jgi:hypothetical protein
MERSALARIEDKLDKVVERLGDVDITLVRQADQLGEHMRRTELAEKGLSTLHAEVRPLTKAHHMWVGVGKGLAILGTLGGVIGALLKLLG